MVTLPEFLKFSMDTNLCKEHHVSRVFQKPDDEQEKIPKPKKDLSKSKVRNEKCSLESTTLRLNFLELSFATGTIYKEPFQLSP